MKKYLSLLLILFSVLAIAADTASISEAQWLWSQPKDNPPMTVYLRREININSPVKKGYFYTWIDKQSTVYLNGEKLNLHFWEPLRKYRGHVKGNGLDITKLLKVGKNVLAIKAQRKVKGCFGIMLRGEIILENGKTIELCSSNKQFVATGKEQPNWNKADFDSSKWQPAWEQGDVLLKPWSRFGSIAQIYCTKKEYQKYIKENNQNFPLEKLLKEPEIPDCKIVYNNRIPGISINGKVFPPHMMSTIHYIRSNYQDNYIKKISKFGLSLYNLDFVINAFYTGKNNYTFEEVDLRIRRILAIDPNAYFMISPCGTPPNNWIKKNPDELVGYAVKNDKRDPYDYYANSPAPSFASEAFRAETRNMIANLGKYVKSQPWGRRVIGLKIAYGASYDGMPWGCHCMPDTGKRMTEAFRRYLKNKYKNDKNLQSAWNDKNVTINTALVPNQHERIGSGSWLKNYANSKDKKVTDYYESYHKEYADYLISVGKAVKEFLPGRLAGSWYGYFILGYEPEGSSANVEPLLKSPYIDFLWATTRGYNLTDGLPRHHFSAFHKYGKLSSIEGDIRTHISKKEADAKWLCNTPEETRSTFQKLIGNTLFYGAAYHGVDFGKAYSWFDCKEALEPMEKSLILWKKYFKNPPAWNADTAVVMMSEPSWKHGHPIYRKALWINHQILTYPLQTLNFSGFSCDWYDLESFIESKHNYKAVILLNLYEIPANLMNALKAKLQKKGVTAIWNYAPGLLTKNGYSAQNMTNLTGIKLNYTTNQQPLLINMNDKSRIAPFSVPKGFTESPRVYSLDKDAQVLGVYANNKQAAVVKKVLPNGSVAVFTGLPFNTPKLWAKILKDAGCHQYTPDGFYVKSNSKLLQIFSGKNSNVPPEGRIMKPYINRSGKVTVKLKQKANSVTDCFTGKIIAKDTDTFTLISANPHTWLLEVK